MKEYEQIKDVIAHIHDMCHALCKQIMGTYLPVAGNVGIFCHAEDEFVRLTALREKLTDSSDSFHGKYFRLHEPIVVPSHNDIPTATYTHLYVRKPDPNRPQIGDIDFYLDPQKYTELKQALLDGKTIPGTRVVLNRPDLDLIELYNTHINALGYIGYERLK